MIWRVIKLAFGLWSPSRVLLLSFRDPALLSWLERWELRVAKAHPLPPLDADIAEGIRLGAGMMDPFRSGCPCESDVDEPGPHIAGCPWASAHHEDTWP